jgi:hypothetical protein
MMSVTVLDRPVDDNMTIGVDENSAEFKAHVQSRVLKAMDLSNRIPHKEAMKRIHERFERRLKEKYGENYEIQS